MLDLCESVGVVAIDDGECIGFDEDAFVVVDDLFERLERCGVIAHPVGFICADSQRMPRRALERQDGEGGVGGFDEAGDVGGRDADAIDGPM